MTIKDKYEDTKQELKDAKRTIASLIERIDNDEYIQRAVKKQKKAESELCRYRISCDEKEKELIELRSELVKKRKYIVKNHKTINEAKNILEDFIKNKMMN